MEEVVSMTYQRVNTLIWWTTWQSNSTAQVFQNLIKYIQKLKKRIMATRFAMTGTTIESKPKKTRQGRGKHSKYSATSRNSARKRYRGQGKWRIFTTWLTIKMILEEWTVGTVVRNWYGVATTQWKISMMERSRNMTSFLILLVRSVRHMSKFIITFKWLV